MDSPVGLIGISEKEGAICSVFFARQAEPEGKATSILHEAQKQLTEYFNKKRNFFDLVLSEEGTDFQKKVWQALRTIPYGQTRSYKQIAELIGQPKAARAVGMANNKNPIAIITPCHRVIGADGSLVGYASGLKIKQILLDLEKIATFETSQN